MTTKVQSEQIADAAISTDRIANDAITTAKIADDVALGGNPTTTTQSAGNNTTRVATTAFVTTALSSISSLSDADSDTKIQVEESSDEDTIRFDVGGTEYMTLTSNGKLNVTEIAHISSGSLEIGNGDEKQVFDASGATMQFQTADTERLRISGNNLHLNGGTDARIQLGTGGAGANQVDNNTVHIRGDGVDAKYMAASGGDHIFEINGGEAIRITSGDGTVGVGVNDPKAHIHTHIASSGGAYHQFTNSSTGAGSDKGWKIGIHDDENLIIWGQESTEMFAIYNNGAYRFYVDHNGNTVIPQNSKLIVSGEEGAFSAGSHNGHEINPNGQSASGRAATNTQTHRSFLNPNGTVGQITTSGTSTTYGGTSDYRLKENVVTDWDGTTLLKQLKPSKFNFKADADTIIQGFLAHEVSSIVPEAVVGEKDAVYTAEEAAENIIAVEGQPKYQQMDHSKLVPLMVKTIQELEARIATLEG